MIEYKVKVYDNGDRVWRNKSLQLHREDGPAVEYADGTKIWYQNGRYHREDGPAFEYADGMKEWWVNGKRHREDGPAIEWNDGTKSWWVNGQRHREDGPAVEYADGRKIWYLSGKELTEEEFNQQIAKANAKIKELTVAEISELLGYEVKVVK